MTFFKRFYKEFMTLVINTSIVFLLASLLSVSIMEDVPRMILLYSHTLIGIFSSMVSVSIFISAWFIFYKDKSHSIYFLGLLFLALSVLDILYTFSYAFSIGLWFWTISRMLGSIGIYLFLLKPDLFHFHTRYRALVILILVLVGCAFLIISFQDIHSTFHTQADGTTGWFIFMTGIILFFYLLSIILLIKKIAAKPSTIKIRLLFGITFLTIGASLFIIFPTEFTYQHSIVGEAVKAVGYVYLFCSLLVPRVAEIVDGKETAELKLLKLQKELSNQILQAQEEERTLLSRELHDGVGQSLYSVIMTLNAITRESSIRKKDEMLIKAKQLVNESLAEVRELAHSLRPSILDDFGFISALKSYTKKFTEIHHIQVKLDTDPHYERLHPDIETALFRICQEALTNCAKHSKANQVTITIEFNQIESIVQIQDNGVGFHAKEPQTKGIGLLSIRERAEGLGGRIHIKSDSTYGTLIEVRIPQK